MLVLEKFDGKLYLTYLNPLPNLFPFLITLLHLYPYLTPPVFFSDIFWFGTIIKHARHTTLFKRSRHPHKK